MSKELKYWLAFNSIEGLGAVSIMKIWNHFNSMKEAWSASGADLYEINNISNSIIEKIITQRQKINPDNLIDDIHKDDIKILCITDSKYPELLKEIYDPPVILYYQGEMDSIDFNKTVALVGTRVPSDYGREMSYKISKELSQYSVTIVSGLAEGIDTCAHTACIEFNGKTIAVLGSGINNIYPRSNINLAKQIIEYNNGLVISEYPPNTKPDSWRFPYRNRVISGLSRATIVVEAKAKGGALITAKNALEHDREVFGVTSRINNKGNEGTHDLIHKGEAHIYTTYQRLFEILNWEIEGIDKLKEEPTALETEIEIKIPQTKLLKEKEELTINKSESNKEIQEIKPSLIEANKANFSTLNDTELLILNAMELEPIAFDIIIKKTGLKAANLLSSLTMLELKGIISQTSGKRYRKKV